MIRPQSLPILCPKGFDIAPVSAQADNNEEENENNIDVDRWADARGLRIDGK
jgi:hypothetical protein